MRRCMWGGGWGCWVKNAFVFRGQKWSKLATMGRVSFVIVVASSGSEGGTHTHTISL